MPEHSNGPPAARITNSTARSPHRNSGPSPRTARRDTAYTILLALTCCGVDAPRLEAAEQLDNPETAIEAGRGALDRLFDYQWYDDENDALRPVRVKTPQPAQPNNRGAPRFLREPFQLLGWITVGVLLAVVAYYIARAYLNHEFDGAAFSNASPSRGRDQRSLLDRVEALPEEVRRETDDLLGAARKHVRNGNYSEAIIYLFSHLLVLFDRHDLLRLAKGKTNRQYLREVRRTGRSRPVIAPALQDVMIAFEDVYYGGHDLPRHRFDACWSKLPELNQQLAQIEQEALG